MDLYFYGGTRRLRGQHYLGLPTEIDNLAKTIAAGILHAFVVLKGRRLSRFWFLRPLDDYVCGVRQAGQAGRKGWI